MKTKDMNPMEQTSQFSGRVQRPSPINPIQKENNDVDIEETATKPLLSPMISHQQQTQMQTTNKFSNFGFFAGSPRQTTLVDVHGNIDQCKEDEIEVSIEEAIEDNIEQINKERIKSLTRQKSKNTQPEQTHPTTLLPKATESPEIISSNRKNTRFINDFARRKSNGGGVRRQSTS